MTGPGSLHEGGPPTLTLVLQLSAVLQKEVSHISVTILTGVSKCCISSTSCSIYTSSSFQQVSHQLQVTLLTGFHEGGGSS